MNNQGQLTLEYILILSIIIITIISTSTIILLEAEKNTIQNAALTGAQQGVDKNAYAMYYNDTYNTYYKDSLKLIQSNQIKIIKIIQKEDGKIIILTTYAHTTTLNSHEKNLASSRINYYIRRNIMNTFNKKTNDTYYNPCYSNNYEIKTNNIIWV